MKSSNIRAMLIAVYAFFVGAGIVACDDRGDAEQLRGLEGIVDVGKEGGPKPYNHQDFNSAPEDFEFAIVTDLTGRLRPNVFPDAVRKLNLLQPDFVMTIGDLIEGHTNDAEQLNREWDAFFKAVEPLEMPIFYVPGNHDYWYRSAQNAAGEVEEYDMAPVYKERVGASYYHFIYKNVLFLVINNTMGDQSEIDEQKRYLADVLEQNKDVRWTFTFFHYDSFKDGELWKHITPLLKNRPFTAFAGNSHNYLKYVDESGHEMIRLATTGGMSRMRGVAFGEFDHVALVSMTTSGPRIANLMLDGIYDTNIRTPDSVRLTNLLLDGVGGGGAPISGEPIVVDGSSFSESTTTIRLANPAPIPLRIQGAFGEGVDRHVEPQSFDVELPADSYKDLLVKYSVGTPVSVKQVGPLRMDWKATYPGRSEDPEVQVTGTYKVIVESRNEGTTSARLPVFVEPFAKDRLDESWVPLGPGGQFVEGGGLVLDAASAPLPGERTDSDGRHTDGPLYETAVHTATEKRVYRYTDGRGIFTMTPLFHLPVAGIYRDVPFGTFEAKLDISSIDWGDGNGEFHWEFWDSQDQIYNYGPSYLRGVIVTVSRKADGKYSLELRKFQKTGYGTTAINYSYTPLGSAKLEGAPKSLKLRATWQAAMKMWHFFYGIDGAEAKTMIPGGEFVEDVNVSPEGKRNLIYVKKSASAPGLSVVLDEYEVLH